MKSTFRGIIAAITLGLALVLAQSALAGGRVHVKGHTKKDGTYVAPHDRTAPDKSKKNNWSTKGNVNPETGKKGTVDPEKKRRKK